jgi:hypothetical protein
MPLDWLSSSVISIVMCGSTALAMRMSFNFGVVIAEHVEIQRDAHAPQDMLEEVVHVIAADVEKMKVFAGGCGVGFSFVYRCKSRGLKVCNVCVGSPRALLALCFTLAGRLCGHADSSVARDLTLSKWRVSRKVNSR